MTINLRKPISIAGYGFRTADDCPGRDPRKWNVEFFLPENSLETHTYRQYHLLEGVETPDWPERY